MRGRLRSRTDGRRACWHRFPDPVTSQEMRGAKGNRKHQDGGRDPNHRTAASSAGVSEHLVVDSFLGRIPVVVDTAGGGGGKLVEVLTHVALLMCSGESSPNASDSF